MQQPLVVIGGVAAGMSAASKARRLQPDLPGISLPGVHTLRTMEDGLALKRAVNSPDVKRIVIIGGGFIGLEVAENLRLLGKEVRILEQAERVLINFDPDFSALVHKELLREGVFIHTGEPLTAFLGEERLQGVRTDKGEYPCDLAVLSSGVRPNCELAGARLLGGQIIGYEGVAHRADILACAITARMTLADLGDVDMCYAPPYKGVWEAVVVAANVAQSDWEERQESYS